VVVPRLARREMMPRRCGSTMRLPRIIFLVLCCRALLLLYYRRSSLVVSLMRKGEVDSPFFYVCDCYCCCYCCFFRHSQASKQQSKALLIASSRKTKKRFQTCLVAVVGRSHTAHGQLTELQGRCDRSSEFLVGSLPEPTGKTFGSSTGNALSRVGTICTIPTDRTCSRKDDVKSMIRIIRVPRSHHQNHRSIPS
jgi:hypothetical protein